MNLGYALDHIRELRLDGILFAKKPWTADSDVETAELGEDDRIPMVLIEKGFEYFLEVDVALEVLEALGGRGRR